MLKIYDEKGNKEKISQIISEMKKCSGISITPSKFGQDNRDWFIDKEKKTISQSLSSVKFVSKGAARDLYAMKNIHFDTFTDTLRYMQMSTCLDSRKISVLIGINYFDVFGMNQKLYDVYNSFLEGKMKLTKTLCDKTVDARMTANRDLERSLEDKSIPLNDQLQLENEYLGMCFTSQPQGENNVYFVMDVEDKYGIKVKLYSVKSSSVGIMKISKQKYATLPIKTGNIISLKKWSPRQRYSYAGGKRKALPGEKDLWLDEYGVVC